jgi:hypothetical protein
MGTYDSIESREGTMNEYAVVLTGYPEIRVRADGFTGCASEEYVFYTTNQISGDNETVAVFPGRLVDYILLGPVERD